MNQTLLAIGSLNVTLLDNGSLQVRNMSRSAWAIGAGCLVVWLVFVFGVGFGYRRTLHCRRIEPEQINCRLATVFLSHTISATELHGVQGASVYKRRARSATTYLRLMQANGQTFVLPIYNGTSVTSPQSDEPIEDQFNRFVADSHTPTFMLQFFNWFGLCCLSLVLLPAFIGLNPLTRPKVTWTFDRTIDTLTVERARLLIRHRSMYALHDVVDASVGSLDLGRGCSFQGPSSVGRMIMLNLRSGQRLPLTTDDEQESDKQQVVRQIRQFLNSPTPHEVQTPRYN